MSQRDDADRPDTEPVVLQDKSPNWMRRLWAESQVRATLVGVVVGFVLTGLLSWIIANQQIDAQNLQAERAIATQKEQAQQAIDAQKAQDERDKRAEVYGDFLQSAQGWADKRMLQVFCNCLSPQDIFNAYSDFRLEDVNLGVWGSDDARAAAEDLVKAIPDTWYDNVKGGTIDSTKPFDFKVYADKSTAFVHVMCQELPLTPNNRC